MVKKNGLHQENRPFKKSKTKTNRKTRRESARPPRPGGCPKTDAIIRKTKAKVLRTVKVNAAMLKKRLGVSAEPPKNILLVPFSADATALAETLRQRLLKTALGHECDGPLSAPTTFKFPKNARPSGKGASLGGSIMIAHRDLMAALDAAKVADVLVAVLPEDGPPFDDCGYALLSAIKAQGMPGAMGVVMMLEGERGGRHGAKTQHRYFHSEFGTERRCMNLSSADDASSVLRVIANTTPLSLRFREDRSYCLAHDWIYDHSSQELQIEGYVRGTGFSTMHGVHLTGIGDFRLSRIEILEDPAGLGRRPARDAMDMEVATEVVEVSDVIPEEFSFRLNPVASGVLEAADMARISEPAMLDASDELLGEDAASRGHEDAEVLSDATGTEFEEDLEDDNFNPEMLPVETVEQMKQERDRIRQGITQPQFQSKVPMAERSQADMDFPDEVDTPTVGFSRERFQKYEGLESLKSSYWDPYKSLPFEFGKIYEFDAFKSTGRRMKREYMKATGDVQSGRYVKLVVANVDHVHLHPFLLETGSCRMREAGNGSYPTPLIVSVLFGHELRVSVMHFSMTRHDEFNGSLPSKGRLELQAGFRRIPTCPIFSEPPPAASRKHPKFRYLRFLHPGKGKVCASAYVPIIWPEAPSLFFQQENETSGMRLACWGSVDVADPSRIIIKRILLTGYPYRVHKRKAVVRYMFFDPSDVRYFKPVELFTTGGLRGHIVEPLGTRGYMKCLFSDFIKQDQTICMPLYKRVFPKWFPLSWGWCEPTEGKLENDAAR